MSFEKYLKNIFEKRCQRNPQYSLRSFARDLGVSPANLSKALSGQRGFSALTLTKISQRLALSPEESKFLHHLCAKKFAKSKTVRSDAEIAYKAALLYQSQVALEKVSLISDWYHMAILALMDANDFVSDNAWIAKRLNLHETVVEQALDRLAQVGAIKKENGKVMSTGNLFIDPRDVPSQAVKEFHHQIIKKADVAIDTQGLDDRDIASMVFAFDKSDMKKAKDKIKKFREEFEAEFGLRKETSLQEVYALGIQFFQLSNR